MRKILALLRRRKRKPDPAFRPMFRKALALHLYKSTVATTEQPQSILSKWIGAG